MTRPQMCALVATMLEQRETLERQAALIGPEAQRLTGPAVKALDYSLALVETDLLEMDAAGESHPEDEARRELPRWSRPKQPVVYVPNRVAREQAAAEARAWVRASQAVDTVELATLYLDAGEFGSVYPSAE